MLSLIVAQANNRVIGRSNELPWYLPADLKHFRDLTTGHTVIMGRRTYESIVARLGKPLPNRRNIVITGRADFEATGCEAAHSLGEALRLAGDDDAFVIGGAQVYAEALTHVERIYLTVVKADVDGDTFFPELGAKWRVVGSEAHKADDKNPYDYEFLVMERV